MSVLEESLRVLPPNRRIFVTAASINSKMVQLMVVLSFRRIIAVGR